MVARNQKGKFHSLWYFCDSMFRPFLGILLCSNSRIASKTTDRSSAHAIFKLPEHLIKVPNERKHPKQINAIDKNGSQLSINNDPSTSYSCLSPSKETSQRLLDEHSYSNVDSPVQPKRRLDDTLATPSTSSSCQSPSKETSQRLQDEHSYSNMELDSPVKLKRRLNETLASMEEMRKKK